MKIKFLNKFFLSLPEKSELEISEESESIKKNITNENSNFKVRIDKMLHLTEEKRAKMIIDALGEKNNLITIDSCATRLRVELIDADVIDICSLKETGALEVLKDKNRVQIIYGPSVDIIKNEIVDYLDIQ